MRRRARWTILLLAPLFGSAPGPAAAEWLPPQVAEGAVRQLVDRLATLGEVTDRERLLEGARGVFAEMRGTFELWGVEGTLERAPAFERFDWPSSGDRRLDAMGRYSVCSLLLLRQLESPQAAEEENARLTSVLGLTAMTLAILRLREPFVAAGGTQPEIEAYLAGGTLEPLYQSIQTRQEHLTHAEDECRPLIVESLDGALRHLAALGGPAE